METLIPIFRLLHFLGFSLLLGGSLASIVLVKKAGTSIDGVKTAHTCMHMLAAPGLVLLMITGIMHASTTHWVNFKGAGYMHAKMVFVAAILLLMIFDLRTQKKLIKGNFGYDTIADLIKKRQALALGITALTVVAMFLINFRPF